MYNVMIHETLGESHRAELLAQAKQERLARQSRPTKVSNGSARFARATSFMSAARARHGRAWITVGTALAATALLLAGEL